MQEIRHSYSLFIPNFNLLSKTVRAYLQDKAGCLIVPYYYRLLPTSSVFLQDKSEETFPMYKSYRLKVSTLTL